VIDAFVSLFRQWVLRSEYWSRPDNSILAGTMMFSLDQLHRRSEQLQKKARRVNLAWTIGAFPLTILVAELVNPRTRTVAAEFFYALLPIFLFPALYRIFSRCCLEAADAFVSIQDIGNPRRYELNRKEESLRMWSEQMGTVLVFTMLAFISIPTFFLFLGKTPMVRSWLSVNLIVFAIQTAIFFTVLKRLNQRAAFAVQQETAAIDTLQKR